MGRKYFTLSYDDGVTQDRRLAGIFNEYGLKCTFNLNSGFFGLKNRLVREGANISHDKLTFEEARDVYKGHEIATHAVTHPNLCSCTREQIIAEILPDRQKLSELCGSEVVGHAYPGGVYDRRVADILRDDCGIRYARTINSHGTFAPPEDLLLWHPTCHHSSPELFALAERFIAAEPGDDDMLFYLWGHAYEFDIDNEGNNWKRIEDFCRLISGKADIVYCTNFEFVRDCYDKR